MTWLAALPEAGAQTGEIRGTVADKVTGEAMTGANIVVEQLSAGTTAGVDGSYSLKVPPGIYTLKISFVAYTTLSVTGVAVEAGKTAEVNAVMEEAVEGMEEVTVTAVRRMTSEASMISAMRAASVVMNGVSAQQIGKAQDRTAAEVVRRLPGVSIIDDRFVIARGLAQRYNNAWVNNSAVPGSEADSRSFSFDMIPGAQIESMTMVKSPAPELPSDFSGGFIRIATKSIPAENSTEVSYGTGFNSETHFRDFLYNRGSATDFIGFDGGLRSGNIGSIHSRIDNSDAAQVTAVTRAGFNNDWDVRRRTPLPDQRFSATFNRRFLTENHREWGLAAHLNYSFANRTYANMKNIRYGIYNSLIDEPTPLYNYTDRQYNTDVRAGGMFNLSFAANNRNRFEFRNIIQQFGKNRYTFRDGWQNISSLYFQEKTEYLYSGRTIYSGQFAGTHTLSEAAGLDWTLGYAYANKQQPDRRIINRKQNDFGESDPHFGQMMTDQNDIERDFVRLHEHITSMTANFAYEPDVNGDFRPSLKAGFYGEYRNRRYHARNFFYIYRREALPEDFPYRDVTAEILTAENYGFDKCYIYEESDYRNNYLAGNRLAAAYTGVVLPLKKLNVSAGVRLESSKTEITAYTVIHDDSRTRIYGYPQTDLFPSVNISFDVSKEHLLRVAYGRSINRQEFRELSHSVYYDFELFSDVKGNPDLRAAYIHNFDFRYECYPSQEEMISVALFYKNFTHPIERTYLDAGGTYTYTFENARSANNYGIEADVKKQLDFIGMPCFSLNLNASLISSKVKFDGESLEHDRPMQGQSPWLVNAGLFYTARGNRRAAGLLYNIIGRRIAGVGRIDTSSGASINNDVPDMYEMPRHAIDLVFRQNLGKRCELSVAVKDALARKVVFKQFPRFYDADGNLCEREQTAREFQPGRNITLSVKVNL
jgi:hypothetical protein